MTNDPLYNHLRESSWRRKLTDAEEAELRAWLAARPEAQAGWEAEAGLNEALGRLPDVPVSSNFTARVLQAVEREAAAEARVRQPKWRLWPWRLHWLPKAALASVLLVTAAVSIQHHRQAARRDLFRSLVASLPSPEILQDFDTIRALPTTPPPDEELIALFQ